MAVGSVVTGSHHHFRHPDRPGTGATVAHRGEGYPARNATQGIERQTGAALKREVTMPSYYPAIVEFASEGFGVFFPDLAGLHHRWFDDAGGRPQRRGRALQAHIDLAAEHH